MIKLIKKLLTKLIKLFFSFKEENNTPKPKEVVIILPEETQKPETKPEVKTKAEDEPAKCDPNGNITTFLWKPVSDNDGNVVVVVGCDTIRSRDLHMELLGKSGKTLKVPISYGGRANKLPQLKYGRIHFRLARKATEFKRSAPLVVRFYQKVNNKKKIVTVMGKDFIKITKPTVRKDLV